MGSTHKGSESSLTLDTLPVPAQHRPSSPPGRSDFRSSTDWGHSGDQKVDTGRKAIMAGRPHILGRTVEDPHPTLQYPLLSRSPRVPSSTSCPGDSPLEVRCFLEVALTQVALGFSCTSLYSEHLVGLWARVLGSSQLEGTPSCLRLGERPRA